ncbi:putative disease resistance RPP13-like protein 1 isoform X1 [Mangifera indica]|uniref:putative disease resistance RPP13-like protein 1 isoform X1 n=1 Tax=Mangifera indica TaxID=29780 RepID=UPI001CF9FA49|nr:putative disease resistance RPP13-like protein 1 isoform X1 [Mangifera indica]XP_044495649.1 putative disease resistance RPP13-like protein 1 isoform X1 [Mangifera indica]XP_044495650.1 putative disease resistance RPP13-like protein 1 isoform X1 [Mangifera indica]XP_044495651.1 putative disease resistance RPP13-like protein 1 isoform X1 [Mangifera indica]XP_044495652.1 putative disease resistance RPP13-like protein 1 isoform X1 [Mangifera indica]XP_044495654.1 putative disease resistance RP
MAFLIDPLVSQLFEGLLHVLRSDEVRGFARQLVGGVDSELEALEKKLRMIKNLLDRAEDIQLTDGPLKEWLDDLQHWAYDAEDVLDEFSYEALRRRLKVEQQASSSNGSRFLCANFPGPLFNVKIGSKIKEINNRLEQLHQQRLLMKDLPVGTPSNVTPQRPEETSSVPPEKFVHGRDEDKAKLVEMVKSDPPCGNNFRVIAIVGMGGIGKTTIAREVYNHKEPEGFELKKNAWICVSTNFDILTISKSLLQSLKDSTSSIPSDLNGVQVELQKAVSGKKFLIVLDDVWKVKYNDWEKLTSPFKTGARGSTMIVTTRDENVAKTIRCSDTYHLPCLSNEACKSLFQEHALPTGTAAYTDQITETIYEKVLKRCSGLPLAAKTLGGLLHSKSIDTWEEILDSKIWNSSKENDALPVLKLSYLYLPPHLKRCFAYCTIFPEDYEFKEEELVLLWMAEGIVRPTDGQLDETSQYFRDLYSRSLFQKSSNYDSTYVMHDLLHNLAESVSKEFNLSSEQVIIKLSECSERIRHFSYIPYRIEGEDRFRGLEKLRSLRTFLPLFMSSSYYGEQFISAKVIFDLLPQLKKLRVLSFERYCITHLPDSIGDLMHLRYLNFSYTRINCLPESTCSLLNLQTLLLKECSCLMKLPSNLRDLTNLYHLDISGQNSLKEMPSGMKELKNLRMLSDFIVGKESSSNLEDLKSLNFLKGELCISNLENAKQTCGFILNNKRDLKVLSLEWGSQFDIPQNEGEEKDVLEMLKPYSHLEELTIRSYGGLEFSSWLSTSSSLSKLMVLNLEDCENCTSLPSQSLLSSLKVLKIINMPKLERIDMQSPFNSLEILCFQDLQKCQYWDTKGENEKVERFPKLRELSIIECPELTVELHDHLPLLEELVINVCAKLMVSFSSFPKCTVFKIDECKKVVPTSSSIDEIMSFKSESLPNIADSKYENWLSQNFNCVEKTIKWSHSLTSVKSLSITNCSISFLNTIFLPKLSDLKISDCEALKSLLKRLKQNNIERLAISYCHSLLFIARNTLPRSLKQLEISECKKLHHLEGISSTLLESLQIYSCESLTHLSSQRLLSNTLKTLVIQSCINLTTLSPRSRGVYKKLEVLAIWNCPRLRSIEEAFHSTSCLKRMFLNGLQNLDLFGIQNLTSLQNLYIRNSSMSLPIEGISTSLTSLEIIGNVEMSKTLIRWGLHKLTSLKTLQISGFEDPELIISEDQQMPRSLEDLTISTLTPFRSILDLGTLSSLKSLRIWNSNLNSIPNLGSLVSLKSFSIKECPEIKSIPDFGSHYTLEDLRVFRCPELVSVACLRNLTSLQTLWISDCPELKSVSCLRNLTSLQTLWILDCPKLKSLRSPPPLLLELRICGCPLIIKHWRRGKGKYCSKIAHIPRVRIDGEVLFNSKE